MLVGKLHTTGLSSGVLVLPSPKLELSRKAIRGSIGGIVVPHLGVGLLRPLDDPGGVGDLGWGVREDEGDSVDVLIENSKANITPMVNTTHLQEHQMARVRSRMLRHTNQSHSALRTEVNGRGEMACVITFLNVAIAGDSEGICLGKNDPKLVFFLFSQVCSRLGDSGVNYVDVDDEGVDILAITAINHTGGCCQTTPKSMTNRRRGSLPTLFQPWQRGSCPDVLAGHVYPAELGLTERYDDKLREFPLARLPKSLGTVRDQGEFTSVWTNPNLAGMYLGRLNVLRFSNAVPRVLATYFYISNGPGLRFLYLTSNPNLNAANGVTRVHPRNTLLPSPGVEIPVALLPPYTLLTIHSLHTALSRTKFDTGVVQGRLVGEELKERQN
ncbi:hypothetical protein DFP72DRAFT_857110 [Ephemerocybe angulata]|uniref:Uncharacterized protein n=1 Tax=Ephemerocybe angulata TaxID=980116 RepID=A0A8H6HES3_9AGAR|nr:hypothetical protein DFP72DRAFT_857110 [Tulosesus angulatus]